MNCPHCQADFAAGMEITLDPLSEGPSHCPHCLHLLFAGTDDAAASGEGVRDEKNGSAERFARRKKVRNRFADRLRQTSGDGRVHCPVCDTALSNNDEVLLRSAEYFRCGLCSHDLAALAYRTDAYGEQRWLPVLLALGDISGEPKCRDCRYVGAIAKACQCALSHLPAAASIKQHKLLTMLTRRADWFIPNDDCLTGCSAIKQYHALAAPGLSLL